MFLQLNHKNLDIYKVIREMVKEVYRATMKLPTDEKFNLVSQIRRAAVSVKLNFSEGASRKSEAERRRFNEIARSSLVEVDAALETAVDLGYLKIENLNVTAELLNKCFAMLSKMM